MINAHTPTRWLAALLLPLALLGCEEASREPLAPELTPSFNFLNGPHELLNVFRFEGRYYWGIFDPEVDLVAFGNMPDDPTQMWWCGGSERPDPVALQFVGELREATQALAMAKEVNLHVYRWSTFTTECAATDPVAVGRGHFTYTDNDISSSGTRTNTYSWRMQGEVTLAGGQRGRLTVTSRFLTRRDGTFEIVQKHVHLHPIG